MITKAEEIKKTLDEKSELFAKSGKKVTKAAARETDKLLQDGKVLLKDLNSQGAEVTKKIGKYTKKAAASGTKIAQVAKGELQKNTSKSDKK